MSFLIFALQDRCRRVICPRDQYARDNKCVPLYSSMTGLDVNVKIEISLVDKVPSKFYSEVLNELENIVNNSLAKCVTLQSREITVWYGPKENKVSDKYYMFDIYLFNASHKIDFGTSVKEIRAFYNNLKTHGSIRVLNGADIRIKIDFSHKLIAIFYQYYDMSISGDGSFRVLLRRRMEDSKIRPSVVISNVNWCYRVPFDIVNETEMIGMEAYIVKPAGITVYKSQYDIPLVSKIHQLYLCFDLFISYFDKDTSEITHDGVAILSDDMTILQPDTDEDDGKILTLSVPVNIAIIAACFGLCVVCVLCKARFKHVEPNALSGTQAIPDTGTVSNVRMSEERAQHIEMVGQDLGNTDSAYNSRETKID